MFTPSAEILFETAASRPGRSSDTTRTFTLRISPGALSQVTGTRRSGSRWKIFVQSLAWTVTPRPRVMKPSTESPGTGAQHLAKRTSTFSMPETRTLPVLRPTESTRRSSDGFGSGSSSAGARDLARDRARVELAVGDRLQQAVEIAHAELLGAPS